jgi:alpha-tubulin suppressor-like RCC1 family protein
LGGDFSVAVSTAANWWLWGKNEEGQLGFGENRENRLAPYRSHIFSTGKNPHTGQNQNLNLFAPNKFWSH